MGRFVGLPQRGGPAGGTGCHRPCGSCTISAKLRFRPWRCGAAAVFAAAYFSLSAKGAFYRCPVPLAFLLVHAMGDARAGIVPLDMSNSMAPTFLHVTSTVQVLNSCLLVFFLVLFGICVSLRAGRFLSARSGRLPSSSCSTSSLQQPAIRQPGYGSFVRPVFHKLCLWSAATRGTSEHGDGGGCYMGARTAALCLLLGSVAVLLDLIPLQLFHGCERRSPAIPPHFLHGCGIVFLVLFGICVSLRAGRFLSARSGRLPSSSCSTSSLQQPAIRQPGYGSFVRPVFKLRLWSAAIRGTSEHGDGGGYYMGARTAASKPRRSSLTLGLAVSRTFNIASGATTVVMSRPSTMMPWLWQFVILFLAS